MTTFDERERALEDKFFHDQEVRWQTMVRRNKLFAEWVATRLGMADHAKVALAAALRAVRDGARHDHEILQMATQAFEQYGHAIEAAELTATLHGCEQQALLEMMTVPEEHEPIVLGEG